MGGGGGVRWCFNATAELYRVQYKPEGGGGAVSEGRGVREGGWGMAGPWGRTTCGWAGAAR